MFRYDHRPKDLFKKKKNEVQVECTKCSNKLLGAQSFFSEKDDFILNMCNERLI